MEEAIKTSSREPTGAVEETAHVPRVQHLVKALTKLVSGKKLYAPNNPRLAQFQDEFVDAMKQFFRVESELVLTIEQHAILWRGVRVYTNEKREDSLAFLLYRDGVGEITIHDKALEGEMDRFVEIVTEEYLSSHRADEDVVTKLWNADFDHIGYRVMDDYLASDVSREAGADPMGTEMPDQAELLPSLEDKGRVIVRPSDTLESIDTHLKRLIMTACTSSDESERETYFQSIVASFFTISEEELGRRWEERAGECHGDTLAAFAESILVFTLLQDNPSAVRDVSGILERIVDFVVADRNARTLCRMLTLIANFRSSQTLGETVSALCDRMTARMTDPSLVQSFEEQLDRWAPGTENVLAYFAAVGKPVVEPLLKLLHRVEGTRLHREICGVLIETAGDDIGRVLDKMDIDNPKVAADAVFIASRISLPRLTPRIQELLYYPDRKIKEEMIGIIGKMDDPGVPELLMGAVMDADKVIRCRAMQAAAARGFPQVSRYLNLTAFGKDLYDRDPDEREAIFKAVGMMGDAVTVEQIRKFMEKNHFMNLSRKRENRILAIRALEFIQEPSAIELLQCLARDSSEAVRTRAVRALAAVRARMQTGSDGGGDGQ